MSSNGDDIDDLVDELQVLNNNFAEFLRRLEASGEDDPRGSDGPCPIDLWDVGSQAKRVTDFVQYRQLRLQASSDRSTVRPIVSTDTYDEKVDIFAEAWLGQFDSFESVRSNTSKEMFADFMREVHKRLVTGFDGRIDEMIDEVEPSPQFLGFPIVEENVRNPETGVMEKEDQIQVIDSDVVIGIEIVCGEIYHLSEDGASVVVRLAPQGEAQNVNRDILLPSASPDMGGTVEGFSQRLASAMWSNQGAELDERYAELLPVDEKNLWDEAN